jgi:hypothetical protein
MMEEQDVHGSEQRGGATRAAYNVSERVRGSLDDRRSTLWAHGGARTGVREKPPCEPQYT